MWFEFESVRFIGRFAVSDWISAIAKFVEILFKIGVTEGPAISDAISRATRGEDPLAGIAKERVDTIMANGLRLEIEITAQHVRVQHENLGL